MNPKSRDAESEHDDAIDAKLDAVLKQRDDPGMHDIPLKRQWDSGLEAELEACFRASTRRHSRCRRRRARAADRKNVPASERGGEPARVAHR